MDQNILNYLKWRCKMNWHSKYLKSNWYIDTWINGITQDQLEYYIREMNNLINLGIYKL